MNRTNAIITAIFAAAIAGAVYWFFTHFERYEETVSTGFQSEARRNPLLAVGRMLRLLGVDARELEAGTWVEQISNQKGTLVLASRSWTLSDADLDALLQWIAEGGHVVTAPETLARPASFWLRSGEDDDNTMPTLEKEDARKEDAREEDAGESDAKEGEQDPEADATSAGALLGEFGIRRTFAPLSRKERSEPITTRLDNVQIPVTYATRVRLQVEGNDFIEHAGDEHGLCFVEVPHGRGRLSVLCSLNGLSNRAIGKHRNATFAWHLFDHGGDTAPVWFLFDTDMPPLYKWLWQNMPLAVLPAAALLCVWLWSLMRRSGPLLDEDVTGSRRTLEHIDASGRFTWRHEPGAALLAGMRGELRTLLERRYPAWIALPDAELYQRISAECDLEPIRVFRALADTPRKRAHFISAVRDLQRLREML